MRVLKFGGSSATDPENVKKIIEIIETHKGIKDGLVVVFSAFKGITDKLSLAGEMAAKGEPASNNIKELNDIHFNMVRELLPVRRQPEVISKVMTMIRELSDTLQGVSLIKELSSRSLDTIMSFGERLSALIIFEAIKEKNIGAELLDTRELIKCDGNFGTGKVNFAETNLRIREYFSKKRENLQITTGFIASTLNGETITLGRGGSDYTASILGAALKAEEIEIWKDVPGVMSADPKRVPEAFPIPFLSYEEASEISHLGAKVIYQPTMYPATENSIPLRIMNTLDPSFQGTLIGDTACCTDSVKGISSIEDISLLVLKGEGPEPIPEFTKRFFQALRRKRGDCYLYSHCSSEQSISAAIVPEFTEKAISSLREEFRYEFITGAIKEITVKENLSLVSVIGSGIKHNASCTSKFFSSLERAGVNIHAIAKGSSELNITAVITQKDLTNALNAVHETFFNNGSRCVNLFIAGTGLIGETLLERIRQQYGYLRENENIKLMIRGICNSRKMLIGRAAIDPENWKRLLYESGENRDSALFIKKIIDLKFENPVLADCTAGNEIAIKYKELLSSGVSIVTPNKRANSADYNYYRELQNIAAKERVGFFYEANVCAGLPVLRTVRELTLSGDQITKIEGVLSGSLSYIFNRYGAETSFADVVREASAKGYTEPDPREDLCGTDVVRKLIILIRECGYQINYDEVEIEKPLPDSILEKESKEEFFISLEKNEKWFREIKEKADKEGKVIRYIASYENGKASVKLRMVGSEHPFYHICESENIVAISSRYYNTSPLVIRGPGAGAEVTASAVFADIIRVAH